MKRFNRLRMGVALGTALTFGASAETIDHRREINRTASPRGLRMPNSRLARPARTKEARSNHEIRRDRRINGGYLTERESEERSSLPAAIRRQSSCYKRSMQSPEDD